MNRKYVWIIGVIIAALVVGLAYMTTKVLDGDENGSTTDGNFVVILLDGNNKTTKYWVLENDTVEFANGWVSFDEKDGQPIHLHSNVIVKEFDGDQSLADIKKQYDIK